MPSDSMAALPVIDAAANLVIEIRLFPMSAAIMTCLDPDDMRMFII